MPTSGMSASGTAHRYDAPSAVTIWSGDARQLERMEAPAAMLQKDLKSEIKARKAFSTMAEMRVTSGSWITVTLAKNSQ